SEMQAWSSPCPRLKQNITASKLAASIGIFWKSPWIFGIGSGASASWAALRVSHEKRKSGRNSAISWTNAPTPPPPSNPSPRPRAEHSRAVRRIKTEQQDSGMLAIGRGKIVRLQDRAATSDDFAGHDCHGSFIAVGGNLPGALVVVQ